MPTTLLASAGAGAVDHDRKAKSARKDNEVARSPAAVAATVDGLPTIAVDRPSTSSDTPEAVPGILFGVNGRDPAQ